MIVSRPDRITAARQSLWRHFPKLCLRSAAIHPAQSRIFQPPPYPSCCRQFILRKLKTTLSKRHASLLLSWDEVKPSAAQTTSTIFQQIHQSIIACERCPRLRTYCQGIAETKRRAYQDQTYWARPVPGFGDPRARILILGLAPGAHGANRTGRPFTGDGSGDFMYPVLHELGFASKPQAIARDDGLKLRHAWIASVVRCAPPGDKPTPQETPQLRLPPGQRNPVPAANPRRRLPRARSPSTATSPTCSRPASSIANRSTGSATEHTTNSRTASTCSPPITRHSETRTPVASTAPCSPESFSGQENWQVWTLRDRTKSS